MGSAFIIRAACYRQEFRPSVVAMADRILITVWMIIFQVSLFLIIKVPENSALQFHKAVVGDRIREVALYMKLDIMQGVVLEIVKGAKMEHDS